MGLAGMQIEILNLFFIGYWIFNGLDFHPGPFLFKSFSVSDHNQSPT